MAGARAWEEGRGELLFNGDRLSVWVDEAVLGMEAVAVTQRCGCTPAAEPCAAKCLESESSRRLYFTAIKTFLKISKIPYLGNGVIVIKGINQYFGNFSVKKNK